MNSKGPVVTTLSHLDLSTTSVVGTPVEHSSGTPLQPLPSTWLRTGRGLGAGKTKGLLLTRTAVVGTTKTGDQVLSGDQYSPTKLYSLHHV